MPPAWSDLNRNVCETLDVPCYTGSIPSELGNLIALEGLDLSSNEVAGESNLCPSVSGTFVVSDGAHVSNGIHDVEEEKNIYILTVFV